MGTMENNNIVKNRTDILIFFKNENIYKLVPIHRYIIYLIKIIKPVQ